jgi:hypothetical protein
MFLFFCWLINCVVVFCDLKPKKVNEARDYVARQAAAALGNDGERGNINYYHQPTKQSTTETLY